MSIEPYHLHVLIVFKSGSLNLLELSGPVQACTGIALPFMSLQIIGERERERERERDICLESTFKYVQERNGKMWLLAFLFFFTNMLGQISCKTPLTLVGWTDFHFQLYFCQEAGVSARLRLELTFIGTCIVVYFYSKTNQMHNFSSLLNITLRVSDGLSVHHQEFKTVHTASGHVSYWNSKMGKITIEFIQGDQKVTVHLTITIHHQVHRYFFDHPVYTE